LKGKSFTIGCHYKPNVGTAKFANFRNMMKKKFNGKWPEASAFGKIRAAENSRFQRVKNCRKRGSERDGE